MAYFKRLLKSFIWMSLLLPILTLASVPTKVPPSKAQLLFVLLSKEGAIHAIKTDPGYYLLTLKGVNPSVIYFTNRPQRYSGKVGLSQFIKKWKTSSFKSTPPNAVMEAIRLIAHIAVTHKRSVSYTVVLRNPQYDSKKDLLTFKIHSLPGSGGDKLPNLAHSDYVALFIDNGCWSCVD